MLRRLLPALAATLGVAPAVAQAQDRSWAVAKADDNGKLLIVRYQAKLPEWVNRPSLPKLVAITWKLDAPGSLPTQAESKRAYEFEDLVTAAVESARVGVLTVVVTGNGVVEWQYYAASHDEFMKRLNQALATKPRFPVAIALQDDPTWSAYTRFAGGR